MDKKVFLISTILISVLGAGCPTGLEKRSGAPVWTDLKLGMAAGGVAAISAFESSVYNYTRKNCASCHGASQAPLFATSDLQSAYKISKNLVNFNDTRSSTFYRRVMDGHCGSNCITDGSAMLAQIEKWKAAETADPTRVSSDTNDLGKIKTVQIAVPTNLPTGTTFTTLRWQLDTATPADDALRGSLFEIEIQRFTTATPGVPGSLRIRKPRLATPSVPLYVKGIRVLVNDTYNPLNNDFLGVEQVVTPATIPSTGPLPFPVLSSGDMIVLEDNPGPSKLSIGFDQLKSTTATNCKNLTSFQVNIIPLMQNMCSSCHGRSGDRANQIFNMTTSPDSVLCMNTLQRCNLSNPSSSPLVTNPYRGTNGHTVVNGFSGTLNSWIQWIESEE